MMCNNRYQKLSIALQHYLYGAKYHDALKAFELAKKIHCGLRKDGITPEFQHQIEIALFVITLRDLEDEEGTIICALLHDILEDYPAVTIQQLENLIGVERTKSVIYISKYVNGKQRYNDISEYFGFISEDVRASIVKGCDRVHNLRSMNGVFTLVKQESYLYETEAHFLPMLKSAAGMYPMQYLAYMNIRTMLKTQLEMIKAVLDASNIAKQT